MGKIIKIVCPKCGEKLLVDVEEGKAFLESEKKLDAEEKLSHLINKVREEELSINKKFEEARKSIEKKKKEAEKIFSKAKEKIEKEKDSEHILPIDQD